MNAKELAKEVYDTVLRAVDDTEADLDADDFDNIKVSVGETIDEACEVQDEVEDEDEEDTSTGT